MHPHGVHPRLKCRLCICSGSSRLEDDRKAPTVYSHLWLCTRPDYCILCFGCSFLCHCCFFENIFSKEQLLLSFLLLSLADVFFLEQSICGGYINASPWDLIQSTIWLASCIYFISLHFWFLANKRLFPLYSRTRDGEREFHLQHCGCQMMEVG